MIQIKLYNSPYYYIYTYYVTCSLNIILRNVLIIYGQTINSLSGIFPVMTYKNATPVKMICICCYHILFSMYNSVFLRNKVMLSLVYSSRHISQHIKFGVLLTADILATLKTMLILNSVTSYCSAVSCRS